MKLLVGSDGYTSYAFSPSSKQVTFTGIDNLTLENILIITNVTDNKIIYNFADPLNGGLLNGNILTLTYNTTTMSSTDALQIFVDVMDTSPADISAILLRIEKQLEASATKDSIGRQRIGVEYGTIDYVSNVTTLNQIASVDARFEIIEWARASYNGLRQNLTW